MKKLTLIIISTLLVTGCNARPSVDVYAQHNEILDRVLAECKYPFIADTNDALETCIKDINAQYNQEVHVITMDKLR